MTRPTSRRSKAASANVAVEIRPDPNNINRGTERGNYMLDESIQRYGAGRSGLADRDGELISGNHAWEAAMRAGLKTRVIQIEPDEYVVLQRPDLDLDDPEDTRARMLSLADNRVGQVNLNLAADMIAAIADRTEDVGVFFFPEEIDRAVIAQADSGVAFLDGYTAEPDEDGSTDDENGPQSDGNRERGLPPMSFPFTSQERAIVMQAIGRARVEFGDLSMAALLTKVCVAWLG